MKSPEEKSTLVVRCPEDNLPERTYVIRELLEQWLGLPTEVVPDELADYRLCLENGARLIVRDGFFSAYREPRSYLVPGAVPPTARRVKCPAAPEADLVAIYGTAEFEQKADEVVLGADLFGSTFFMLARWEEHVNASRDDHERTPSSQQLSVRDGFDARPVVNEYVETLWTLLQALGYPSPRRERRSQQVLTHDVDRIYAPPRLRRAVGAATRGDWKRAITTSLYGALRIDPRATFLRLMQEAEDRGGRARFYFIPGGTTRQEGYYGIEDPPARALIETILERGHVVGFHPSYDTYDDAARWTAEKERLDALLPTPATEGRQHYLRFHNPTTWRLWAAAGMTLDSTIGFSDRAGFRSGTGDPYRVFDILDRRALELREQPLILMDAALRKLPEAGRAEQVKEVIEASGKYSMQLTTLVHNHLLDPTPWNHMELTYQALLEHPLAGASA